MNRYLIPSTGLIVDTFEDAKATGAFFVRVNAEGNSCLYNGDAMGHSKGFCTASACY